MPQADWRDGDDLPSENVFPLTSAWRPMVGGVVAAGVMVSLVCPRLSPQSLSRGRLVLVAAELLFVAVLIGWLAARMIDALLSRRLRKAPTSFARAAWVGALWVPAWILCLKAPSLMTVIAGCFCMVSLSRSMKRYDVEAIARADEIERALPTIVFQFDSTTLARVLWSSLALSVLTQVAVIAMVLNWYELASILFGSVVAVLVWRGSGRAYGMPAWQTYLSNRRATRTSILAFAFTIVVLLPYLRSASFSGGLLTRSGVVSQLKAKTREETPASSNEGYTGIILLPIVETHKKIVAPHKEEPVFLAGRPREPVVIPFDGAYWYFKFPDKRPRPNARVVRGNSAKAVISSTDRYPLMMEAHQRLATPIDLNCCSQIDISVQNADRREGTIALELWVRNTALPRERDRYLGSEVIASSQPKTVSTIDLPKVLIEETLRFPVPAAFGGVQFDEIMVVVRAAPERARVGAQIAIRQFVLRP